jgi:hypothetical protein
MKDGKYQNASRLLEKARQWPERLGVGKPYDVDNRFEDYLEVRCAIHLREDERAGKFMEQVAAYTRSHADGMGVNRLFGALAERSLGHEQQATEMVEQWSTIGQSSMARWLFSIFHGDVAGIAASETELRGASSVPLLGRALIDQDFALLVEVFRSVQF